MTRPTGDDALNALPDQHDYLSLARNVLHGEGFVFHDPRFPDELRAFRTPGYPIFLAACGANARIARLVQALIDTSTVLAVYCLARRLTGDCRRAPLLAAIAVAINPFLIYFSGLLLTETLFTAMLAWGMLLLLRSAEHRGELFLAGLLLSASILVRPSGVLLAIPLGVMASQLCQTPASADSYQSSHRIRRATFAALVMTLLTLLVLLPWTARNRIAVGRWIPLDTNSGFTLYDGFNPAATGASDQRFVKQMPELQAMNEVQRSDYLRSLAKRYAVEHPVRVFTLAAAKLARLWSPITLSSEYGRLKYQLAAAAYAIPLDLLVLVGLVSCGLSRSAKAFLLTPPAYFSMVHALTVGSLRYRVPVEPLLAVIAAVGLAFVSNKICSIAAAHADRS